jgi:polyisoprenoid-binding protein YceI
MRRHDAQDAELLVFTKKEGLLSKVAHDLKLRAGRFELEIEGESQVRLTCHAASLRVVNAMLDGREAPELLNPRDKVKIEDTLAGEILSAPRHPEIRFVSTRVETTPNGYRIHGELTIAGTTRDLSAEVIRKRTCLDAEVSLRQTDYGIKPFTALFGTLKVQDTLRVTLSVPEPEPS